jgi:hypothetical protein
VEKVNAEKIKCLITVASHQKTIYYHCEVVAYCELNSEMEEVENESAIQMQRARL